MESRANAIRAPTAKVSGYYLDRRSHVTFRCKSQYHQAKPRPSIFFPHRVVDRFLGRRFLPGRGGMWNSAMETGGKRLKLFQVQCIGEAAVLHIVHKRLGMLHYTTWVVSRRRPVGRLAHALPRGSIWEAKTTNFYLQLN